MAVVDVQVWAARGPCARRGVLDAGVGSRRDVVGAHRSKERLSAAAQRCRAGLVVVSLQGAGHGDGKNWPIWSTVRRLYIVGHTHVEADLAAWVCVSYYALTMYYSMFPGISCLLSHGLRF